MPRPKKTRWVGYEPGATYFKPQGIPLRAMQIIVLTVDELEALRLAHLMGYSQEQGAEIMKVSRATFGRILDQAHIKVSEALVAGKAIQIQGGQYRYQAPRRFFDMPERGMGYGQFNGHGGGRCRGRWRRGRGEVK